MRSIAILMSGVRVSVNVHAMSHEQGVGKLHDEHRAMEPCVVLLQRHNRSLLSNKMSVAAVLQPVLVIHHACATQL